MELEGPDPTVREESHGEASPTVSWEEGPDEQPKLIEVDFLSALPEI